MAERLGREQVKARRPPESSDSSRDLVAIEAPALVCADEWIGRASLVLAKVMLESCGRAVVDGEKLRPTVAARCDPSVLEVHVAALRRACLRGLEADQRQEADERMLARALVQSDLKDGLTLGRGQGQARRSRLDAGS